LFFYASALWVNFAQSSRCPSSLSTSTLPYYYTTAPCRYQYGLRSTPFPTHFGPNLREASASGACSSRLPSNDADALTFNLLSLEFTCILFYFPLNIFMFVTVTTSCCSLHHRAINVSLDPQPLPQYPLKYLYTIIDQTSPPTFQ